MLLYLPNSKRENGCVFGYRSDSFFFAVLIFHLNEFPLSPNLENFLKDKKIGYLGTVTINEPFLPEELKERYMAEESIHYRFGSTEISLINANRMIDITPVRIVYYDTKKSLFFLERKPNSFSFGNIRKMVRDSSLINREIDELKTVEDVTNERQGIPLELFDFILILNLFWFNGLKCLLMLIENYISSISAKLNFEVRNNEILLYGTKWVNLKISKINEIKLAKGHFKLIRSIDHISSLFLDYLLGFYISNFISFRKEIILAYLIELYHHATTQLNNLMILIFDPESGIKINQVLNLFLFTLFKNICEVVHLLINGMKSHFKSLSFLFFFSSKFLGFSLAFLLFADGINSVRFLLLNLVRKYNKIFVILLKIASTLIKLFRGRKRNVITKKIDVCHYQVDQLIISNVLMAITILLIPTLLVYKLLLKTVELALLGLGNILRFMQKGLLWCGGKGIEMVLEKRGNGLEYVEVGDMKNNQSIEFLLMS